MWISIVILTAIVGVGLWLISSKPSPPPPEPSPPPPPPTPPPRVDRPVDWGALRGVTAFALYRRDRAFIREFCHYIHEHGYTWLRCGSQTDGWRGFGVPYLAAGPAPGTREWRRALEGLLEETARIPDTWVELIPTFTHKQDDQGSQAKNVRHWLELCRKTVEVIHAGAYKHVFLSAANEPVHPISKMKDEDVLEILHYLKHETGLPVGVDHHGKFRVPNYTGDEKQWFPRFPHIWRPACDFYAFHPPRNPSPHPKDWLEAIDRYQKTILWDETTCWASDEEIVNYSLEGKGTIALMGRGTERDRQHAIYREKAKARATEPRGRYLFHSIWGIECRELGWLPHFDDWSMP